MEIVIPDDLLAEMAEHDFDWSRYIAEAIRQKLNRLQRESDYPKVP